MDNEAGLKEKKGVSAVIYDDKGQLYFLIFHRIRGWEGWEFPKGRIGPGETPEDAVAREITEETGLRSFRIIRKMDEQRVFEKDGIRHIFDVFLVEASMNVPVVLQKDNPEHDTYLWATEERALEKLTWDEEKTIFRKALSILNNS